MTAIGGGTDFTCIIMRWPSSIDQLFTVVDHNTLLQQSQVNTSKPIQAVHMLIELDLSTEKQQKLFWIQSISHLEIENSFN